MPNGYLVHFRGKNIPVYAETSYEAQKKAIAEIERTIRPRGHKWKYDVHVRLCEAHGIGVVHNA